MAAVPCNSSSHTPKLQPQKQFKEKSFEVDGHKITWKNRHLVSFDANDAISMGSYITDSNEMTVRNSDREVKFYHEKTKQEESNAIGYGAGAMLTGSVAVAATEVAEAVAVVFGGLTLGLGALAILAVGAAITYDNCQSKEQKKYNEREAFNNLVRGYKTKVQNYQKLQKELQNKQNELTAYIKSLDKSELLLHLKAIKKLSDNKSRIILAIGPTGYGKSLVCNRLFGDKSNIEKIRGDKNRLFGVASDGDVKSCTDRMTMAASDVEVHMPQQQKNRGDDIKFKLYATDTVGADDNQGRDVKTEEIILTFCNQIGGVNAFLLFFKYRGKLTASYKKLLKKYNKLWGDNFWNHCILVITHCEREDNTDSDDSDSDDDDDEKLSEEEKQRQFIAAIKKTVDNVTEELNKVSNGKFGQACSKRKGVFTFGKKKDDWRPSVLKLLLSVYKDYNIKYRPLASQTKIDKRIYEMEKMDGDLADMRKDVATMKQRIENLRSKYNY